jgi:DNA-binding NarL/FixJ family response regulator
MKNPTVILADDEVCIRQTTALLLLMEKIDVLGEAADGEEALALCRKLRPTFLLADLRLPKLDAVSVLLRMRSEKLPCPVMIYSGCNDESQMISALAAKPAVFVHKMDQPDDFRAGVRCAVNG